MQHTLSIAGADDKTSVLKLQALALNQNLEVALLYFPEKEGEPRNPSKSWRETFYTAFSKSQRAIHLCGTAVFEEILSENFEKSAIAAELHNHSRVQININARRKVFSDDQVLAVYAKLIDAGHHLILQWHPDSAFVISLFINANLSKISQISVLLDASRGKGVTPENWDVPEIVKNLGLEFGVAGGLNAENITEVKNKFLQYGNKVWFDLETGARTDNEFDLSKVVAIMRNIE